MTLVWYLKGVCRTECFSSAATLKTPTPGMPADQISNVLHAAPASAPLPPVLARALARSLPEGSALELQFPGEAAQRIGTGVVRLRIAAKNGRGVAALKSLDEIRIGEAYLFGDLNLDGDLLAALDLRNSLTDRHLLAYLWSTYGQRLLHGQTARDKQWISEHYDADSDFYLTFLDKQFRCYSHGYFEREDEPLESAIERKLTTAFTSAGIQAGMRVLDIGAGWGAFTEFAGKRGAQVTSLTISKESESYCNQLIRREALPCQVVREHFLEFKSSEPFDAIVNLGVTEHLPDYRASLAQYQKLVKPGGRVYLDACSSRDKYPFSTFILKYIWPGNATPLHLPSYLEALSETPLELLDVHNDRWSYLLTARWWAENLDRQSAAVIERWGQTIYRRFRLYLWGCVQCFATDVVGAYRWMLQSPVGQAGRTALTRRTPGKIFDRMRKAVHL
jgi:cyclopropane-fatty-acyl-phospholipid synthase